MKKIRGELVVPVFVFSGYSLAKPVKPWKPNTGTAIMLRIGLGFGIFIQPNQEQLIADGQDYSTDK